MSKEQDAAEAYVRFTYGGDKIKQVDSYLGFLAGIAWHDANPSAEVLALVSALDEIMAKDGYCIFGTANMLPQPKNAFRQGSALTYSECAMIARKALAQFKAKESK